MKSKVFISLFFIAACLPLSAQNRLRPQRHATDTMSTFVKSYEDSLKSYRMRLDSLQRENATLTALHADLDGKYARLFVPMTFYHDMASRRLQLGNKDYSLFPSSSILDDALMHIYIYRPDLVKGTQSMLNVAGPTITEGQKTIKAHTNIVEKVAPAPTDADLTPVDLIVKKPNFWKFNGDYYLQFVQGYVSGNWYQGGESNYNMLGNVTLQANYNNRQRVKWDNKLEMRLGFQTSRNDTVHSLKTWQDQLRYTGSVGLQASKRWYYTFQLIATTQFMRSYRNNDPKVYSDFLSPLNINASLGMDYNYSWLKNRLTGKIHLAPFAYNYRYVKRDELVVRNGIKEGSHHMDDYGSEIKVDLNWRFTDMISWNMRLFGFTSYKRAEIECENTINFQFNKYISSKLYFYPRFDDNRSRDNHHGYWQFRETLSIGFSYSM